MELICKERCKKKQNNPPFQISSSMGSTLEVAMTSKKLKKMET